MLAAAQELFAVEESSQVAQARRRVVELAREQHLSEAEAGNAAIAVTEAATNMIKHAEGGRLLLRALFDGRGSGIEVIAFDNGRGIADWQASLRDGFSSGSTPGTGLGAMQRLSTEFDVYTAPQLGCVFRMAFRAGGQAAPADGLTVGVVCQPIRGETECGDGWAVCARAGSADRIFMMADGLGHGPQAAEAANAAVERISASSRLDPATLLEEVHGALRATRGAAVGIAQVQVSEGAVQFAGVGNTSAVVYGAGGENKQFASHPGIAGTNLRKVAQYSQPWSAQSLLIMHSDGINTHWNLAKYPGLASRHPGVIAAVLFRDQSRGRDDATVLVARVGA